MKKIEEKVTLQKVAEEIGVSRPTLYRMLKEVGYTPTGKKLTNEEYNNLLNKVLTIRGVPKMEKIKSQFNEIGNKKTIKKINDKLNIDDLSISSNFIDKRNSAHKILSDAKILYEHTKMLIENVKLVSDYVQLNNLNIKTASFITKLEKDLNIIDENLGGPFEEDDDDE